MSIHNLLHYVAAVLGVICLARMVHLSLAEEAAGNDQISGSAWPRSGGWLASGLLLLLVAFLLPTT